jgi:tetratricopeptide (TPR) repeat protein
VAISHCLPCFLWDGVFGMEERNWPVSVVAIPLFFIFFALYLFTLCPTLYWRDSGEFIPASFELGVAHPAGSPFYLPVAKLFTFLPFGSIAFRVNLVSAFFGALIVCLLYLILLEFLDLVNGRDGYRTVSALFTAVLFGVSEALWDISVQTEVYTVQHFFFALIVLLLIRALKHQAGKETGRGLQIVCMVAFLSGLALGAHITFFFYFPAVAAVIWCIRWRGSRWSLNEVCLILFLFILGGSIYLYLPLRAVAHPYFDWGEPETLRKFLIHVSDRKDSSVHLNLPIGNLSGQFLLFLDLLLRQFTALGVPLIVVGGVRLWRRHRFVLFFLAILALPNFAFFIRYWSNAVAYVPTFFCMAMLLGVGVQTVLVYLLNSTPLPLAQVPQWLLKWGAGVLMAASVVSLLSFNFLDNDKHNYWWARDFSKSVFSEMANNAIVLSQVYYFQLSYLNQVENWRPDVTVINKSDFYAPDYFQKVRKRRFPNIAVPIVEEEFLFPDLVNINLRGHPIYWEPNNEDDPKLDGRLIPNGYLYRVSREKRKISSSDFKEYEMRLREPLERAMQDPVFFDDDEGMGLYQSIYSNLGFFFVHQNLYANALKMFKVVALLKPDSPENLNNLGLCYADMRLLPVAKELFEASLRLDNRNIQARINLGHLYLESGEIARAESYLEEAIRLEPESAEAHYHLGIVFERQRRYSEARREYETGLKTVQAPQTIDDIRRALARLSTKEARR